MQKVYVNEALGAEYKQKAKEPAEYAGFWVRLAAYVIDSIIVFAALLVVRLLFMGIEAMTEGTVLGGNVLFHYTLKDIVLYGFQVLYFILCTYFTGTTLGKRALSLRVVSVGEEEKLTLLNVVYRETVGRFLSGLILCIGYLMIGIDKEKRGLHDMLCDTRVVYGKRIKLYIVQPAAPARPMQVAPPTAPVQKAPDMPTPPTPVQNVPYAAPQAAPPVQSAPDMSSQPIPPVQNAPYAPPMPEGGYQFVRPENATAKPTEMNAQEEDSLERDS